MKRPLLTLASVGALAMVAIIPATASANPGPRPSMWMSTANSQAQSILTQWEQAAHRDPYLNVRDDLNHSNDEGNSVNCWRVNKWTVDCHTRVTFSEDRYVYQTINGQPYAVYKNDRVSWTMRFRWSPAIFDWHLWTTFPGQPVNTPSWPTAANFGGRALHRAPGVERDVCGSPGYPCDFVPYGGQS